jgi:hypothetical protein
METADSTYKAATPGEGVLKDREAELAWKGDRRRC